MKTEEKRLLDWQEKIEALRTKTTELKTASQMLEKQLNELGVNAGSAAKQINDLTRAIENSEDKIKKMLEEIEDEFDLGEES